MAEQRLIYANALLKTLECVWDCNDMVFEPNDHICTPNDCKGCKWRETLDFAKRQVKASKTVDAVPVVRCKDCQNYEVNGIKGYCCMSKGENWYCADGKRKDGESND